MKKILLIAACSLFISNLFAQDDPGKENKKKVNPRQVNLSDRSNDHLMIQIAHVSWSGKPDSINTTGLPRSFNMYFLYDFPFKSDSRFSIGAGAGVSTENIYFEKTYIGIKDLTTSILFKNVADTNHFKKYKLATAWLEAPIELRFSSNPSNNKKSIKAALGVKIGTLLNAHTKGKTWQSKTGSTLIAYTQKESGKRFFNTNRLQLTGRFGLGNVSLFGNYQLVPLFKEGLGPPVRPLSIGITFSGL